MSRKYFGTDGIRGRVGTAPISADFVLRLGNAYGYALRETRGEGAWRKPLVVIGKDTRISNYMFEAALEAGLVAAGVDVQLMGPMPTPAVAHLTHSMRADGGIVISASHNPHHDNGIKFFSAEGEKLDDATEAAIEAMLEQPFSTVASERLGKAVRTRDAVGRYVEACKNSVPRGFDLDGMRIAMDCANGATYQLGPLVLRELGARVDAIGIDPDGTNINAGVGSTHPETLAAHVLATGADLGIAFDGDADRIGAVDETGQIICRINSTDPANIAITTSSTYAGLGASRPLSRPEGAQARRGAAREGGARPRPRLREARLEAAARPGRERELEPDRDPRRDPDRPPAPAAPAA